MGEANPPPRLSSFLAFIHRSAWNRLSRKFISSMLHNPTPYKPRSTPVGTP